MTQPGQYVIDGRIRDAFSRTPCGRSYLAEAEFGLREIEAFVRRLPSGSRVLEVGSGPSIALATLLASRPDLEIHGIEPVGSGFGHFDEHIRMVQAIVPGLALFRGGYEEFPSSARWHLIFLVNVLEHLPDWRHFLGFVHRNLLDGGACVILCPNYGFPYESHFGLPIILNKAVTGKMFERRITAFERKHGLSGLYGSLNFVKLADLRRTCRNIGLSLELDPSIMLSLLERLDAEPDFAQRHPALGSVARIIRRAGALDWLLSLKVLQNRLPYLKLILRRERGRGLSADTGEHPCQSN